MNTSGRYTPALWAAIWLVVTHFAVTALHAAAHFALGVVPPVVDDIFIVVVIWVTPVVALPFVLRGSRAGAAVLALALAASMVYGIANHFVIEGADHATGLDQGAWPATFTLTGLLLLGIEAAGAVLAAWLFWRASKTQPRNAPASEASLTTPR